MAVMSSARTTYSQMGFQVNEASTYQQAGGDLNFANNQLILTRMATKLLRYSTITSATLKFTMIAKNGGVSSHRIRAQAYDDAPILQLGTNEWKPVTSAFVDWLTPAPVPETLTVNVTSIVQELVNRPTWKPGGYITFAILTLDEMGTDIGIRANHEFAAPPILDVVYQEPVSNMKYNFNLLENSEFDPSLDPIDTTAAIPYWGQQNFFDAWVNTPNLGTIARDTSFTRRPGVATLRFTCGTPPAEPSKRTGPITVHNVDVGTQVIFGAWVFVPSYIPADVYRMAFGEYWMGMASVEARGTWVPVVTGPYNMPNGGTMWTGMGVNNFQAGWQFWISEPFLMESNCRQMPFVASSQPLVDSSGNTLVSYKSTVSKQRSYREWTPRTGVKRNGVIQRVPRFTKRADGIFLLSEPVKGGPTIANLPAQTISSLPAGKTVSEL